MVEPAPGTALRIDRDGTRLRRGDEVLTLGGPGAAFPLPTYPGAEVLSALDRVAGDPGTDRSLTLSTPAEIEEVVTYYREALQGLRLQVSTRRVEGGGDLMIHLTGRRQQTVATVSVTRAAGDTVTGVSLSWSGPVSDAGP